MTSMLMNARILIVDDHELLREGVKSLLKRARPEWAVCGEASNGEEAIRFAQQLKPHVIILDISMPRMSGFEACLRIRKLGISTPILIFTTHYSERLTQETRDAGAQGYVVKSQAAHDLVLALDELLAGGTFFGRSPESAPDKGGKPSLGIIFRLRRALSGLRVDTRSRLPLRRVRSPL